MTIGRKAGRRRGFTLLELMVAVGILAVMIMSFGIVVARAQIVVAACQEAMRLNTKASVVAQLLTRDLVSISKDGFLDITGETLSFTRVAPHTSYEDPSVHANAAVVVYGLSDDILYHQTVLLVGPTGDSSPSDASSDTLTTASTSTAGSPSLPSMDPPPVSFEGYPAFLATNCSSFSVTPWNGSGWASSDLDCDRDDLSNWPRALRIRYTLTEVSTTKTYEVICDLP